MRWADVLADPALQNLPYKIELNEYGKIVMTPASNRHGSVQVDMALRLRDSLPEGKVITECSIQTAKGVKVADVVWCSVQFLAGHGLETPYTEAPDICVEVVSPSDSEREMEEKRVLYFERGAEEVWIVSEDGEVEIFGSEGVRNSSLFEPRA